MLGTWPRTNLDTNFTYMYALGNAYTPVSQCTVLQSEGRQHRLLRQVCHHRLGSRQCRTACLQQQQQQQQQDSKHRHPVLEMHCTQLCCR
jgi:hypothetical protein